MSGTLKQREALAILIGWQRADSKKYGWVTPPNPETACTTFPARGYQDAISGNTIRFNPFENAADDYAVLEWMRNNEDQSLTKWASFLEKLSEKPAGCYQVGDYARALLKTL